VTPGRGGERGNQHTGGKVAERRLWLTADEAEQRSQITKQHKSRGHDVQELQAAKLYVEIRIGELLGPALTAKERGEKGGRGNKAVCADEQLFKNRSTAHELRRLAWYGDRKVSVTSAVFRVRLHQSQP
jgi:hypothetical protein